MVDIEKIKSRIAEIQRNDLEDFSLFLKAVVTYLGI